MLRAGIYSFLLFFTLFPALGYCDPKMEAGLSKNEISSAETTELTFKIQWPKSEGSYSFAIPDLPLDRLVLVNQAESQESFLLGDQEFTRKTFSYELKPKEPGEGGVEAFNITYIDSQNPSAAPGQLQVDSSRVRVSRAKTGWNISSPKTVLFSSSAFAGLLALFLVLRKKKRNPEELGAEEPVKEKNLREIQKRIQSSSVLSDQVLPHLSKEFGEFLKEVYSIDTARSSESEIAAQLKAKNVLSDEMKSIERILNQLREFKFTGQRLSDLETQILKKEINVLIESKRIHMSSVN